MGTVEINYDRKLEAGLCPNDEIRERMEGYRKNIDTHKLQRVVSTRFLRDAYLAFKRWELDGRTYGYKTIEDYMDAKLMGGWSEREVKVVRGELIRKS